MSEAKDFKGRKEVDHGTESQPLSGQVAAVGSQPAGEVSPRTAKKPGKLERNVRAWFGIGI